MYLIWKIVLLIKAPENLILNVLSITLNIHD